MSTAILEQLDFDSTLEDATGGNVKVFKSDYRGRGRFPVIDQGQDFVAGYVDSEDAVCQVELPVIVFGDHTCAFKFVDFPFVLGADGVKVLKPKPGFDAKFLYYWLCQLKLPDTGYDRHFKYLKRAKFPPRRSLAEQKRIAAILDKADAILRRRQEAARLADTLIPSVFYEMFGDPVLNPRKYETQPLGALADMVSGGTPSKSVPEFWAGSLPWVSPKDMKRPYLADATDHITEDAADDANLKVLQPGAILIVVRGMILAHTVPLAINRAPLTINQDMRAFVPHDGIETEYLCWALRMQHGRLLSLVSNAAHGTKRFESRDLFALSVPLPPKPQQKRFAAFVESTRLARQRWEAGGDNADDFFNALVQRAFRGEL